MILTRRTMIAASAAMGLGGCSGDAATPGKGWLIARGPKILAHEIFGLGNLGRRTRFEFDSKFRVASITKLAISMAAQDWADAGRIDLDAPVDDVLPATRDGLTLRHLLSHLSGLKDPAVYWAAMGADIRSLYSAGDFTHAPGTYFRYSNLNYGLAASVMEMRLVQRFDLAIADWFAAQQMDAGLNWSGVSAMGRAKAVPCYRKENGRWTPQVDANVPVTGPDYLGRDKTPLTDYQLGSNGTLFSPQGGLRCSLLELITLGEALMTRPALHDVSWRKSDMPGNDEDGHFLMFGPGAYHYTEDISPIPGVPLIGHLGEAYGAYTGVFFIPGTEIVIAFAQTGTESEGRQMTGGRANQAVQAQAFFDALAPALQSLI